jgi:hypothetical protein
MLETINKMLEALASIFSSAQRDARITEEKAEKLDIKNRVREVRADVKIARLSRKLRRIKERKK